MGEIKTELTRNSEITDILPDPKHASVVMDLLNKQRQHDPSFSDVSLYPTKDQQRRDLRVHKCLLSLNPNIFKMLKERQLDEVKGSEWYAELDMSYSTLNNILNYMYTGNCEFKQENRLNTVIFRSKQSCLFRILSRVLCCTKICA